LPDNYCTLPDAVEKVAKKEFPDRYKGTFVSPEDAAALSEHVAAKEELARYTQIAEQRRIVMEKVKGAAPFNYGSRGAPRVLSPAEIERLVQQQRTGPSAIFYTMTPERLAYLKEASNPTDAISSIQDRVKARPSLLADAWLKLRQSLWRGDIAGYCFDDKTGQLQPIEAAQWGAAWANELHSISSEAGQLLISSVELRGLLEGRLSKPQTDIAAHDEPLRTGVPGRPTSWRLIEQEFRRRCDAGEVALSLGSESRILSTWLKEAHPDYPRTTPKTIENNLRSAYNAYKTARKAHQNP
jgi:hypothetical protein